MRGLQALFRARGRPCLFLLSKPLFPDNLAAFVADHTLLVVLPVRDSACWTSLLSCLLVTGPVSRPSCPSCAFMTDACVLLACPR